MEDELEMNEEQKEDVVDEVVQSDDIAPTTLTDEVLPFAPSYDISPCASADETTSYVGDEEATTTDSIEDESSENIWGSLDCRSECKYNTGNRSKYANYGYSD